MTVRRVVPTSFWRSLEALDHYSQEERYFALYLMTNPKCSQVGIYSLPKRLIAFETGLSLDQVDRLLDRFSQDFKKIAYSHTHQEVTLLHSLSYSIFVGGRPVMDLLEKELSLVQDTDLIEATFEAMRDFWLKSSRRVDQAIMQLFVKEIKKRRYVAGDDEKDKEVESDKEDGDENDNEESASESSVSLKLPRVPYQDDYENQVLDRITFRYQVLFNEEMPETDQEKLKSYCLLFEAKLLEEALYRAKAAKHPLSYYFKILERWDKDHIYRMEDLPPASEEDKRPKLPKKTGYQEIVPAWAKRQVN
ncbi:hypothetical protein [Aerococcus loyolae]|uniref:DnaD domain-containing protein n=1 Tax=Aerococcus loyolae TaxID=2976809 RepID=A0ABT4BXD5_9LACT|nr:hypothetical protein [Aerococcus loyolae]MCY3024919.1 hypothetical protein [Aerococcus loyolae]MCY3027026.1 hypothetical protein [Aerococcus loyolae]MCY3028609.1 hypothetical protein [Aerococcus loyolae]OAM70562.1 hypothetical protein A1D21_02860 [Aerococcus loyolae]